MGGLGRRRREEGVVVVVGLGRRVVGFLSRERFFMEASVGFLEEDRGRGAIALED